MMIWEITSKKKSALLFKASNNLLKPFTHFLRINRYKRNGVIFMNRKEIISLALIALVALSLFSPSLALAESKSKGLGLGISNNTPQGTGNGIQNRIKNVVSLILGKRAAILSGEIKTISGTTLVVTKDGTDYTILTDDKTKFRRRFWGKSTLSEFAVGNLVNVIGKWNNEEKTEINANLIRNLSIQKRFGVFFGTIKSITDTGFVMTTAKRGEETVTLASGTKLVNRKMEVIGKSDILVDHRVRVKGLWDSDNHTITEVTQVKDFNLPVIVKPSPSPEATE